MRRKVLVFQNGYRSVIEGNGLTIAPSPEMPFTEVDMDEATEEEFREIKRNPHRQDLLDNVKNRGLHKGKKDEV